MCNWSVRRIPERDTGEEIYICENNSHKFDEIFFGGSQNECQHVESKAGIQSGQWNKEF